MSLDWCSDWLASERICGWIYDYIVFICWSQSIVWICSFLSLVFHNHWPVKNVTAPSFFDDLCPGLLFLIRQHLPIPLIDSIRILWVLWLVLFIRQWKFLIELCKCRISSSFFFCLEIIIVTHMAHQLLIMVLKSISLTFYDLLVNLEHWILLPAKLKVLEGECSLYQHEYWHLRLQWESISW